MTRFEVLTDVELAAGLAELNGWSGATAQISRVVEAPSFLTGIDLVARVAAIAEAMDHHPDIDIRWRRVRFALSTHDAGGVTPRDLQLAAEIDRLAAGLAPPI